jgi:hypothetical protein
MSSRPVALAHSVKPTPRGVLRVVVLEVTDNAGEGFEMRVEPEQGLKLALRLAACVAKLMRVEQ